MSNYYSYQYNFSYYDYDDEPFRRLSIRDTSLAVTGIVLNIIVIFASSFMVVTSRNQSRQRYRGRLRKRPNVNFFPILLAIVNIVNLCYFFLLYPFYPLGEGITNTVVCKLFQSTKYILHSMVIYCVVALCCHVYSAVCNKTLTVTPVIKHRFVILLLVVFISVANSLPIFIRGGNIFIDIFGIEKCEELPYGLTKFNKFFVVYFTTMAYVFPLVIITILYSNVVLHLHRSSNNKFLTRSNSTSRSSVISKRRKLIIASVILTISFYVCYFPTSYCFVVYAYDFSLLQRTAVIFKLARPGILCHSCIVPIIWCITTDYKRYFKRYFTGPCRREPISDDIVL